MEMTTSARELLRHCLATIAYRGGKTLRDAPASFADFKADESSRTPVQILAHIGDLLDWGLSIAKRESVLARLPASPMVSGSRAFLPFPQSIG